MTTSFAPGPGTSSLRPVPPDAALETALTDLVADGTLSAEQAHAVRARRAGLLVAPTRRGTPSTAGPEVAAAIKQHNPLPEILGYVGAALVGSALLNLVIQSWESWTPTARLALVVAGTVALYVAGLSVAVASGWRHGLSEGSAVRRRVVALLLAVGAGAAGLTTLVVVDTLEQSDQTWVGLVSGVVAVTAAALGAWLVRGVLSTLAVAAGSVWLAAGAMGMWPTFETAWYLPLGFVAVGAVWLALAPRLLAVPVLSEALGWAFMLVGLVGPALWSGPGEDALTESSTYVDALQTQAWVARGVLAALAVVGMTVFLRGGRWPWAAGGVSSGVFAALAIGGQTLNWIMAMLVAGVVLLLLSAILVVVRRRSDRRHAEAVAPPPT